MTTDTFEDELRSLLHDTADAEGPAYVDVDPNAVVTRGRRVVRRRRLAAGAGIAAAIVALGGVGVATLDDGVDRTSDPAVSTSVPTATGPVSVQLSTTLPGPEAPRSGDPVSARVEVDEQSKTWSVSVTDADGRTTTRPAATLPANPGFSTYAQVGSDSGLIVGVMPAAAKDIAPVWLTDSVESNFSRAPLRGTDRQAFAVRYSGPPGPYQPGELMFAGFDWTDGEQVFTSAGTPVPSARFGDAVAFVDEQQNLFGIFGPETTVSKRVSGTPQGKLPGLMTGRVPDGSGTMASTVLVLLPAGATGVEVSASPGATVQSVDTAPGGSLGRTMVLVRLTGPRDTAGTGVERLRWTNADGSAGSGTVG